MDVERRTLLRTDLSLSRLNAKQLTNHFTNKNIFKILTWRLDDREILFRVPGSDVKLYSHPKSLLRHSPHHVNCQLSQEILIIIIYPERNPVKYWQI